MTSPTVVLCILDGVGWGRRDDGDAVFLAATPHLDALRGSGQWRLLKAHGTAVGLPSDDDMGNSEVGHNAMGAGRIYDQGAKLVDKAIREGSAWQSAAWKRAVEGGGTLHLLGLLSDGNVHANVTHVHALIDRAVADGVTRLRVHVLTDGRDVDARSALTWVEPLEARLAALPIDAAVASGGGRMHITMDRYQADWEMVARGWACHVHGEAPRRFPTATEAITTLYAEDRTTDDQWLPAFVVGDYAGMQDGDAAVCWNFRGDRAIEISRAFDEGEDFDATCFPRGRRPAVRYAGMMEYDGDLHVPAHYLVEPPAIDDTVGQHLAAAHKRVLATSETQKFGHVTFFFNGNRSEALPGEDRVEIPSDNLPFNQAPAMKAQAITDVVVGALREGGYDQIRLNLANGDMVGHTGALEATITALEEVDRCVGRIAQACRETGAVLLLTADHGNADEMFRWDSKKGAYAVDAQGQRVGATSHSKNPVPVALLDPTGTWELTGEGPQETIGGIAQVGATLLELAGLPVPEGWLPSLVRTRG